jgi:dTDP-4-dehydrorhamnose reductase
LVFTVQSWRRLQLKETSRFTHALFKSCRFAEASLNLKRPMDSSLDTAKAQETLKNKPLEIHEALNG